MMEALLSPGLLLGGRYRIESFIGVSELGEVYAALDLQLGRECAVKLLPAALKLSPSVWNAFQEQSRSVAALTADTIARAADFGSDPTLGRPFVVSERIGFPSLATLVAGQGRIEALAWAQALSAFAPALDAASAVSIAHGDIKPNNLFFSPEHPGWARLSDFGMLLLRGACPPSSGVAPLGWAALEQTRGEPASRAGDLFSLGLVTFYALTGRHFLSAMWQASPDPGQVLAELRAPPLAARAHARSQGTDLPAALDPWFARALNQSPSARFQSAEEAAHAFAELLANEAAPPRITVAATPTQASGVAAAIAAPLLFQELPRPSAATGHAEAPHSSRPPGFAAPRASTTEHVAGLPTQPPVALLAAVGVGLIAALALASFGLVRLFSSDKPATASAAEVAAPPPPSPEPAAIAKPLAPPAAASSADPEQKAQANFACAPVACEWIVCDGENVKKGQLELGFQPGKHSCSASRYGYRTAVTEFVIEAGRTTRVVFELLPTKTGTVRAAPPAKAATINKAIAKAKKTATAKPVASSKATSKSR